MSSIPLPKKKMWEAIVQQLQEIAETPCNEDHAGITDAEETYCLGVNDGQTIMARDLLIELGIRQEE